MPLLLTAETLILLRLLGQAETGQEVLISQQQPHSLQLRQESRVTPGELDVQPPEGVGKDRQGSIPAVPYLTFAEKRLPAKPQPGEREPVTDQGQVSHR